MEKILANVNGMPITEADVERFIAGLGSRASSYNNPEGKKVVLQQLINNKLLLLDAKRNLLEAEAEFKAELARLRDSLLVSYASEKIFTGVKVTDKEAEEYYENNKEKFTTGEGVNASHILVDSEELACELIEKINTGAISFEDAAREYSSCPSKENGGNLGDALVNGGSVHAVADVHGVQSAGNEGLVMTEHNSFAAHGEIADLDGLHRRSGSLGQLSNSVSGEVGALLDGQSALSDLHAESHASGAAALFAVGFGGKLENIQTFQCHDLVPPYSSAETSSEMVLTDAG